MKVFKLVIYLLFIFQISPICGQSNYLNLGDGTRIYMEESGKGQSMLFIPGWTMTGHFFEKQQHAFSKNYHVITYDPRGQGLSDKTNNKNSYADHAIDLKEIIEAQNLEDVILIGWSSGCLTIYEYIRKYGFNKIQKLVFIDEPPKWIGDKSKEWVYGDFDGYRSSLKSLTSGASDPNGIIDWMLQNPVDSATREWMCKEIKMTPRPVALSLYVDGLASDYTPEIEVINKSDVPALFMLRESWHPTAWKWLKNTVPKADIISISSHAMFWEKPEEFNQLLLKFLSKKNQK